jgi:hypothetical protein
MLLLLLLLLPLNYSAKIDYCFFFKTKNKSK